MDSVQLKIEYENALRRASVSRHETLAQLKATIAALVGITDCDVKYRDEENDLITIGSDQELQDVLEISAKSGKILRLIVSLRSGEKRKQDEPQAETTPAAAPVPPREPEIPWVNLARALSDPQVVERIQQILQSPVLTETVNRAARAYVDTKGDVMMAGLIASQQIPLLLGLVADLLEDLPVLKDLQKLVMTWFANHHGDGWHGMPQGGCHMPMPGGCHPMPHGPGEHPHGEHTPMPPPFAFFAGPPHHHHGGHKQKHFGIFCDGCGSDEQLKQASIAAGHQTRRGFISGSRFKSETVHDFDLCESCKVSNRFPDTTYGPFTTIQAPQDGPRGGRGGGGGRGCGWWRGGDHHRNWRHGGGREQHGAQTVPLASPISPPQQEQQQQQQQQQQPQAKQHPDFEFLDVIRSAFSKGAESFLESTKDDESNDFTEIARAIAESLKQEKPEDEKKKKDAAPKNSEWVPMAAPVVAPVPAVPSAPSATDPFVKWASQLSQLQTLGFDNLETYIVFLEEEKGDLDRVVNRIVSRDL
jgi:hypothetical protein